MVPISNLLLTVLRQPAYAFKDDKQGLHERVVSLSRHSDPLRRCGARRRPPWGRACLAALCHPHPAGKPAAPPRPRPASAGSRDRGGCPLAARSEEHTSELQSLMRISYAVFCLKKKQTYITTKPQKD